MYALHHGVCVHGVCITALTQVHTASSTLHARHPCPTRGNHVHPRAREVKHRGDVGIDEPGVYRCMAWSAQQPHAETALRNNSQCMPFLLMLCHDAQHSTCVQRLSQRTAQLKPSRSSAPPPPPGPALTDTEDPYSYGPFQHRSLCRRPSQRARRAGRGTALRRSGIGAAPPVCV